MCARVTTQRGCRATLASFLRWHLHGARVDHVFLYLDAPHEDAAHAQTTAAPHAPRVSILLADDAFRAREAYRNLPSWGEVAASVVVWSAGWASVRRVGWRLV